VAEPRAIAEVWLWDEQVGAVAEMDDNRIVFQYSPEFSGRGWEISPLHLKSREGVFAFPELARKPAFNGLPGVLADALPDSFGKAVIRSYFTARGQVEKALSPVQHLLYVGRRAIGALEFRPAEDLGARQDENEALEIAQLVGDARRIIEGQADVAIPEIYRIGSSAGGMRPKAVVLYNDSVVRSAFADPRPGDIPALLKFDGVNAKAPPGRMSGPQPYNRIEAAYSRIARSAGIDAVDVRILEGPQGHAHLLIPRFDIDEAGRSIHQHTLGGLLHVDYNEPGASSYEEYMRVTLALGMSASAINEAFRRLVFNVLAINQDDHVKNLSYQMLPDGSWRLSPAYDLTFAKGTGWTAQHQMRIGGKTSGITRPDMLELGKSFGVKRAERIIGHVQDALAEWPQHAAEAGVPPDTATLVAKALEERRREVG
jgi:serine/threonine-protein kinase HipA